jgi:O-acetylhomoserine/O-acetylserine sulfhydrylase-like pyridoxal-dependent enzyme
MDFIEKYFYDGSLEVISIIYTDFLVTIMEIDDKEIRETIKKMMKPETAKQYMELFKYYQEPN